MRYLIAAAVAVVVRENHRDNDDVRQITNGVLACLLVATLQERT